MFVSWFDFMGNGGFTVRAANNDGTSLRDGKPPLPTPAI